MNEREYELATLVNTLQYDISKLVEENSKLREDLREGLREGISLRDHFAGLAMQGLLISMKFKSSDLCSTAYAFADVMMAEREKGNDH